MADTNVATFLPPKTGAMAAGHSIKPIVPQTLEDVFRLANVIFISGLAPEALSKPESISIALLHGLEVGLPPMMALQSIAVINGRPTIWGDGALGLVRATGLLEEFSETIDGTGDKMIARCTMKRRGEKAITHEFTVADAIKAGLWGKKGPWQTYPRRMMAMRPRSWCLRDVFADILKGLRIAEEVMDYDEPKDITPGQNNAPARSASPPSPPAATVVEIAPEEKEVPQAAAEAQPEPLQIEHDATETVMTYESRIEDWKQRLAAATPAIQDEIFESEIDPFREAGGMQARDYNDLMGMVPS
jgi:hypothetical protein